MKYFLTTVFLIYSLVLGAQERATIGMGMDDVLKIYPAAKSAITKNTAVLYRADTLHGLTGEWGYRFENNRKLDWIHFDKYINEINRRNFKACLNATRAIISGYTRWYGKPDTIITGNTKFIDPYKKHHWGYDVLEARWRHNGMKIKVEFTFMGGKGEYSFLVKVNYFDKDYPYYD